ncbi:hypothetical protein SAMN05216326_10626 [Nitrosomonas marina]|uniref:Uncharacterized protein n=1 Tax=Nitrosomonas marina TaxID=917 RepID=A0A1I0A3T9_9PROT|nr:hypothetical protein SAMN05216326_10626 [Nitrosomonas marina]
MRVNKESDMALIKIIGVVALITVLSYTFFLPTGSVL